MAATVRTENYDALLSSTLRRYQPRLHDNIMKSNKYLAWMDMNGRVKPNSDGGERMQVFLLYQKNTTVDIYSNYGLLDTTPQDGMTSAFFEWGQFAGSISISGAERLKNTGRSRILNLLESKTYQTEESMKEMVNASLIAGRIASSSDLGQYFPRQGRIDSAALAPLPLPALIDANPARSVSIGGINGSIETWWQNHAVDSAATTHPMLRREMINMYNRCTRGGGGQPDLMVGDQVVTEIYWSGLEIKEQYIITAPRVLDVLGGSTAIKFLNAAFIWDEMVVDPKSNAGYGAVDSGGQFVTVGTDTLSTIYFITSAALEVQVMTGADFRVTDMVTPVGQDASVSEVLWMGGVGINNRRKLGVLFGISRLIA
jgi:hypothetical protein